ncbi:hypothetical protein CC79DRAFT_1125369 [Sarocladium strictum]
MPLPSHLRFVIATATGFVVNNFVWNVFIGSTGSSGVNPVFSMSLGLDHDRYQSICNATPLHFTPGLLDIIRAPEHPTVEWVKDPPPLTAEEERDGWAVYAIVLEKDGSKSILYVRSAAAKDGMLVRLEQYARLTSLPSLVRKRSRTAIHSSLWCRYAEPAFRNLGSYWLSASASSPLTHILKACVHQPA